MTNFWFLIGRVLISFNRACPFYFLSIVSNVIAYEANDEIGSKQSSFFIEVENDMLLYCVNEENEKKEKDYISNKNSFVMRSEEHLKERCSRRRLAYVSLRLFIQCGSYFCSICDFSYY